MLNKIAIICVLRTGGDFCSSDVEVLYQQLQDNITLPFNFYCLSNAYSELYKVIPLKHEYKGWWSKIELFRPGLLPNRRILYFDLDTVIAKNIDQLLEVQNPFIGLQPFNDQNKEIPNYMASGIMGWENDGRYDFIYEQFKYKEHSGCFRGDQDYINFILKLNEEVPVFWQDLVSGVVSYKRHIYTGEVAKSDARVVCFHGRPRPNATIRKLLIKG